MSAIVRGLNPFNSIILIVLLQLLLLLIPLAQPAPHTRRQIDEAASSKVDKVKEKQIEKFVDEVINADGNISALYILRTINKRVEAIQHLEKKALKAINRLYEHQIPYAEHGLHIGAKALRALSNAAGMLMDQALPPKTPTQLERERRQQMDTREYFMELWDTSKLKDEDIGGNVEISLDSTDTAAFRKLEDYVHIFNERIRYLEREMAREMRFRQQQHPRENDEVTNMRLTTLFEMCHELCLQNLNLLKQSLLEIRLFHDFGKIPFIQIADEISKYKVDHETDMKLTKGKGREEEKAKEVQLALLAKLSKLITAVRHLHAKLLTPNPTVLEMKKHAKTYSLYRTAEPTLTSLSMLDTTEKFLTSLLEVAEAEIAEAQIYHDDMEIYPIKGKWKEDLQNLVAIWHAAVNLPIPKMIEKEVKEMHEIIKQTLEMPMDWYSNVKLEANPDVDNDDHESPTLEMLTARVILSLAQTLLVYERLNAFYKIEHFHEVFKKGKFPAADQAAYNLLKSIFVSIENKYLIQSVGASSTVHGHGLRRT